MSGRKVATKLLLKDQPELPKEAQIRLEQDKLFFLEKKNAGKQWFTRDLTPGEELPYTLHPSTMVRVLPHAREFYVDGKQMLVVVEPHEVKKPQRAPQVLKIAELQRERSEARKARGVPPSEQAIAIDREARKEREHARQAARRLEKQQRRDGIRAAKRIARISKMAQRRATLSDLLVSNEVSEVLSVPAITYSSNTA